MFYANTVFNCSQQPYITGNQGDLCLPIDMLHPPASSGRYNITQQNANTVVLNSVVENVTNQGKKDGTQYYKAFKGLYRDEATMMLADVHNFDFRPVKDSPLVAQGVVFPPFTHLRADGTKPDVGAYQHDDAVPWTAGCSFTPACHVH